MNASPIIPRIEHADEDPPTPFMGATQAPSNLLSYMSPLKQQHYLSTSAPQRASLSPPAMSLNDMAINDRHLTINALTKLIETLENQNARLMTMFEGVCMRSVDNKYGNKDLEARVIQLETQNGQLLNRINKLETHFKALYTPLPLSPRQ
jgi:hypothetical protein